MIRPKAASDKLLFNTVRISGTTDSGSSATATGFLFDFPLEPPSAIPCVVTNKHVREVIETGEFFLHRNDGNTPANPGNESVKIPIQNFRECWISHPNPDIDLCAAPLMPLLAMGGVQIEDIYRTYLGPANILSDDELGNLRGVEDVIMVGYPQGFWDDINNMPLVRRGITATHAAIDFKGRPEALIDMACFVGSSGSPVILLNEGMIPMGANNFGIGSRCILLGVLYSGLLVTAEGAIEYHDIPTVVTPVSLTKLTCHLGTYVKSRELLVLGEEVKKYLFSLSNETKSDIPAP